MRIPAQKITTFLMFSGRAEEAITFYTRLFPGSAITQITRYGKNDSGPEGKVLRAHFTLMGQPFMAIDSPVKHEFGFTPSISLFVACDSEEEVDRLFSALCEGGSRFLPLMEYPFSKKLGWVADRFGVSWQLSFGLR